MKPICLCTLLLLTVVGCTKPPVAEPDYPPSTKKAAQLEPGPVDPDAPEEYTTTESGLKYRIRRKSTGKMPVETDIVRVHYRGTLDDGTMFDSSYGKFGKPAEFPLNGVIKGWTEGLQLIGEGGMIELLIRPELGYGEAGTGPIPPNATLHFIVELLEIKK